MLFFNFVRTDRPDHSHCNKNFTFNQTIQSDKSNVKSILFVADTAGTSS